MSKEITQGRRIAGARARLLLKTPFWGHLVMHLESKDASDLQFGTMATDGTHLFYDSKGAMLDWDDDQLMGAIVHESGHCGFGHLWRRGDRDPMLWNMATDYAINGMLDQEGFVLPPNILLDAQYSGMSAEKIYSMLLQQPSPSGQNGKPLDDPTMWENACSGKEGEGEKDENGNWVGHSEQYWKEKVVQAAHAAKMQGKLPAHLASVIDGLLEPKLNWKDLLQEYVSSTVKNDYRLMPPNKRFMYLPLYMPRLHGEHVEIVAAIDTSGSVSDDLARQFMSEIKSIAEQFESYTIHYFQCDAQIQMYKELTLEDEYDWPMEMHGRGGTSFIPVFEEVDKMELSPPILVYLTDLMGSFPDSPDYPVLWVSSEEGQAPFGTTIVIEE